MSELHLPWLELSIVVPLVGAVWVGRTKDAEKSRHGAAIVAALALACALGVWIDFWTIHGTDAADPWDPAWTAFHRHLFVVDALSAPLLPLTALLYLLMSLATLRTKIRRFSFAWSLVSEALILATLSCKDPWAIIALLALSTVPPFVELRARRKPVRVYALHMALFVGLLAFGWWFVESEGRQPMHTMWAIVPLLIAVFIRSGIVPFHCWMTDLFEHATFGTALLFVLPIPGAYAAVRLLLPVAPDWVMRSIGMVSLFTALYAAGMALVQREVRRFFCYLFLSHSALVLVGLETLSELGLTGALCVWLSLGLSLAGFGLTLRALEARHGRMTLVDFHGGFEQSPTLASCFAVTGLASVGFPGTFGFVGTELLVDGVVHTFPHVGVAVVIAAALNGIAVLKAFFVLFTGRKREAPVSLQMRGRERVAVLTLTALILAGGVHPQPGVESRHHAAIELLKERGAAFDPAADPHVEPFQDETAKKSDGPPLRNSDLAESTR